MPRRQCFFGRHLVQTGIISPGQLDRAISRQKQSNTLLGKLARERNLLAPEQIEAILEQQKQDPRRFGELAVDMGFISGDQLDNLLDNQANNHIYLGEALIKENILSQDALVAQLNIFQNLMLAHEEELAQLLSRAEHGEELLQLYEITRTYFFRIGFLSKAVRLERGIPEDIHGAQVFMEQHGKKGNVSYFGTILPESLLGQLASPLRELGDVDLSKDREIASEVLHNLNFLYCERCRKSGRKVRHGAVRIDLPSSVTSIESLRLQTTFDDFAIAYCT
ncbi:hypothetical protein [Oceanidesulfovibrio marinus]|uniref:Uncharacterized protein n=1 Tax=Oceanidesulfovibrio marinus TaxID=370038 RepID=A0ABX6NLI5_9BACT|nr:hypothetical protein [Oceanidesulfovibrio marinus]QJT11091.1 hypothetical protein E8L03_20200 [Oceanidesulfovibrio marinus]